MTINIFIFKISKAENLIIKVQWTKTVKNSGNCVYLENFISNNQTIHYDLGDIWFFLSDLYYSF